MYHMLRRREHLGNVLTGEQDAEEGMQVFLDRFDLEKQWVARPPSKTALIPILYVARIQVVSSICWKKKFM